MAAATAWRFHPPTPGGEPAGSDRAGALVPSPWCRQRRDDVEPRCSGRFTTAAALRPATPPVRQIESAYPAAAHLNRQKDEFWHRLARAAHTDRAMRAASRRSSASGPTRAAQRSDLLAGAPAHGDRLVRMIEELLLVATNRAGQQPGRGRRRRRVRSCSRRSSPHSCHHRRGASCASAARRSDGAHRSHKLRTVLVHLVGERGKFAPDGAIELDGGRRRPDGVYVNDRGGHRPRTASGSSSGSCSSTVVDPFERRLACHLPSRSSPSCLAATLSSPTCHGRGVLPLAVARSCRRAGAPRRGGAHRSIALDRHVSTSGSQPSRRAPARRGVQQLRAKSVDSSSLSGVQTERAASRNHTQAKAPIRARNLRPGATTTRCRSRVVRYSQPTARRLAVHSLEHGAVWIAYSPIPMLPRCRSCVASRSSRR